MHTLKFGFFLSLRTILFGLGLVLTALLICLLGNENPIVSASPWWPVYGLFANIICLLILICALKKEKVSIVRLINFQRPKIRKDLLISLLFIPVSMVIAVSAAFVFGYLLYGRYPFEIMPLFSNIPIGIVVGFAIVFPVVNSVIEEITYNGYIFPRLEAKMKSRTAVIVIILFFFTLQHLFITFVPDVKYLIWRLLSFVPLLLLWILIYVKQRRLTSLFLIHWFMDLFAILSIVFAPR